MTGRVASLARRCKPRKRGTTDFTPPRATRSARRGKANSVNRVTRLPALRKLRAARPTYLSDRFGEAMWMLAMIALAVGGEWAKRIADMVDRWNQEDGK